MGDDVNRNGSVVCLLLVMLLINSCSSGGGAVNPSGENRLVGSWQLYDPYDPTPSRTEFLILTSANHYHRLISFDPGWRERYSGDYTATSSKLTLDQGSSLTYSIRYDTLYMENGIYYRISPFGDPDQWVKSVTALDSVESRDGDLTFDGTHILEANGNLYRYTTDPYTLQDSSSLGSSLHGIAYDGAGLWIGRWNHPLVKIDPTNGDTLHVGPTLYTVNSLAWGNDKLWLFDANHEVYFSYSPATGTFQDTLNVRDDWPHSVCCSDGYLWFCVDGRLHKCNMTDFSIVQSYQFEDRSSIVNQLATHIQYMATDGTNIYLNTQKTDGSNRSMLYRVQL